MYSTSGNSKLVPRQSGQDPFAAALTAADVAGANVISIVGAFRQLRRAVEISKEYCRNWLFVEPTVAPQKSIVAKVSSPSKRR
jgi:hypothetical protein